MNKFDEFFDEIFGWILPKVQFDEIKEGQQNRREVKVIKNYLKWRKYPQLRISQSHHLENDIQDEPIDGNDDTETDEENEATENNITSTAKAKNQKDPHSNTQCSRKVHEKSAEVLSSTCLLNHDSFYKLLWLRSL